MFVALIVAAMLVNACGRHEQQVLRIGTNAEYPPFEYKSGAGFSGVDIDLGRAIAARMGMECQFIDMDFEDLLPALAEGKLDMAISCITITDERKAYADFSDPYYHADNVIVAKPGTQITINKLEDLAAYKVGAQNGTTGQKYLSSLLVSTGKMPAANLLGYALTYDAIDAMLNDKIDFVIIEDSVTEGFNQLTPVVNVMRIKTNERYGIALPKGSKNLAVVNDILSGLKADGSLTEILGKYFGDKPVLEAK